MGGVYIHIPFCASKCPYCDFYSMRADGELKEKYADALCDEILTSRRAGEYLKGGFKADTLYLGGGTPSELEGEQLLRIISLAKKEYGIPDDGEITVECNPSSDIESLLPFLKEAGVNRISLGMQSADETERKKLGRMSGRERILEVTDMLHAGGIENISLDIMLGVPLQTEESLHSTLEFAKQTGAKHISTYVLKLEEGTFFYKNRDKLVLPDENSVCDMFELCCRELENAGFSHYEISNFALPGYEGRHNTKYWLLEDYLGIGAAAHSFVGGKRFFYERDINSFIAGAAPVFDCEGGDSFEYIMLRLRLKSGLSLSETAARYGEEAVSGIIKKAPLYTRGGLIHFDGDNVSLTEKGMLLSNAIICSFL